MFGKFFEGNTPYFISLFHVPSIPIKPAKIYPRFGVIWVYFNSFLISGFGARKIFSIGFSHSLVTRSKVVPIQGIGLMILNCGT